MLSGIFCFFKNNHYEIEKANFRPYALISEFPVTLVRDVSIV